MPINVNCPECHYHFLVGDEFAGQPGRCPECTAVIQVPRPGPSEVDTHDEPNPYRTRRHAEKFEDFPNRPRRSRYDQQHDEHEHDPRDDYDDEPRQRSFDPEARAAKWRSVSSGLRNLMVAVILVSAHQALECVLTFIEGIQPGQQNVFGSREKALILGQMVLMVAAFGLWAMGRIGCGRVPYVPARRAARPAGIIAGITASIGIVGIISIVVGVIIVQQNMGLAAMLMLVGICAFMPALLGFAVAELMGLVSQVRMATGLNDVAFGRASRVQLTLAILLTSFAILGMCGLMVFMMGEMGKKQQQIQQKQQAAPQPINPNGKKEKDAPAGQQPVNPPPGQQPPPPELDPGDYPQLFYAVTIIRLLMVLAYTLVSVICFQLGRSAIRREIAHLVGDPHDHQHGHDLRHDPHY